MPPYGSAGILTPPGLTVTDVSLAQWRESYAAALNASNELRAALARLGLPERSYRSIRPATTSTGRPYVYLGILNAEAVAAITAALLPELARPGLSREQDPDAAVGPTPRPAHPGNATRSRRANAEAGDCRGQAER